MSTDNTAPLPDPAHRVWFFAYGSLMWQPGFEHDTVVGAVLDGYHRALCIYSWVWRGTPEKPGLVLGLAEGLSCEGQAIGVKPDDEDRVLAYLDERELVTEVYRRKRLPLRLATGHGVEGWCYVARPGHEQYAGDLSVDRTLALIRQGHGRGGPNRDYVLNTVAHLRMLGIRDPRLEELEACLATDTGMN
ncbi:MAG: gamma-glutamylcyclotransferase [Geminicoccaceae bacterium]|nr:gamma-glutamylcyclotransferase [Geminicoccaceae bacterium]MCB9944276.1 gamma-glutamylcyclotransferase [Geminicoccaceae bacterium]